MANQVIKSDGTKAPFDAEKIKKSIELAGQDVGLPAERVAELVVQVSPVVLELASKKEEIASSELKNIVLRELDRVEPAASAAWRKYDQTKAAH
jgi:transcriptional regulator NrdR family protein